MRNYSIFRHYLLQSKSNIMCIYSSLVIVTFIYQLFVLHWCHAEVVLEVSDTLGLVIISQVGRPVSSLLVVSIIDELDRALKTENIAEGFRREPHFLHENLSDVSLTVAGLDG